jgi:hypothetical protein
MKGSQNKSRIISVIITVLVILMLIISEPAGAVTVNVDTTNMPTTVGQEGYFYFNVTIGGNEKIPVANFTIEGLPHIDGSPNGTLVFEASDIGTTVGSVLTEGNYDIKLVEKHGWKVSDNATFGNFTNERTKPYKGYGYGYSFVGYGYGYGYGSQNPGETEYTKLAYQITVNTAGAIPDTYDVTGKINTGIGSRPYFSSASTSTSSFTLEAKERTSTGSSSGGSSKSWVSSTPISTEPINTTEGQATPIKTETEDVSEGGEGIEQDTQAATTPTETEDGGLPGFSAIMFITGLLAAAYIIIRKRG